MYVALTIVVIAALIWFEKFYGNKNHRAIRNMPGPPTLPFIGNAHQFMGSAVDFLNFTNEIWHKYGRRIRTVLGPDVFIMISDPKDVEVLLSSNEHLDKSQDYEFLHPWLGLGLLTSTGERWRRHRKFLTPAFHFSILRHFVPIFDRRTDSFLRKLEPHAHAEPVDIYPLVTRCTLDQLSESAMGTSTEDQSEKNMDYVDSVKQLSQIVNDRMKNVMVRADWMFRLSPQYTVFTKALKVVKEYTNTMIQQRKKVLSEQKIDLASYTKDDDDVGSRKCVAFLDLLLLSEIDGRKLDETAIKNEVETFLFEGHDTTASGISFTLYLLAANSHVQEKCYQEQKNIFANDPDRETEFRDIHEMKYLELALKEALRIYPPVPLLARHVRNQFQLNDLTIPAGTDIAVNVFNMNRDPEIFPDPMKYIPERFLTEEASKRHPYSNVTFSAGPRNCIGQKFAMYEMKMTLSKLIRHYRFSSADMPPLQLAGDLVLKSANGIHIRIHKRQMLACGSNNTNK